PTPCCARPGDRGARTCSERCRGRAPGAVLLPPVTGVRSSVASCSVVVVVVRAVPADGAPGSPPEGGPVSGPAGGARSAGLGEQHHEDDRADAADQVVLRLDAHGEGDEGDDPHRPELPLQELFEPHGQGGEDEGDERHGGPPWRRGPQPSPWWPTPRCVDHVAQVGHQLVLSYLHLWSTHNHPSLNCPKMARSCRVWSWSRNTSPSQDGRGHSGHGGHIARWPTRCATGSGPGRCDRATACPPRPSWPASSVWNAASCAVRCASCSPSTCSPTSPRAPRRPSPQVRRPSRPARRHRPSPPPWPLRPASRRPSRRSTWRSTLSA